jgi:hypothetical protein
MGRAELRRQARKEAKKDKTYTLTQAQIDKMKDEIFQEAVDTSFGLMLSIPVNILGRCYWEKSASKRLPQFINECLGLYESVGTKTVEITDIIKDVEEVGNLEMNVVERIRRARLLQDRMV